MRFTGASDTMFQFYRFNPVKTSSSLTLYWIRSNRDGSDNAAIESTSLDSNYRCDHDQHNDQPPREPVPVINTFVMISI